MNINASTSALTSRTTASPRDPDSHFKGSAPNGVRIPPPAQAPSAKHQADPYTWVQTVGIDDIILSYSSEHWLGPWHDDSGQR